MERNPDIPYTYQYSQPEEYHFSIDSIEMAWEIAQYLKGKIGPDDRVLDLCSGCGVIGFELNFHLPEIQHIDFVEVQNIYEEHFKKNLQTVLATPVQPVVKKPRLSLVTDQSSPAAKESFPQARVLEANAMWINYEEMTTADFKNKYRVIVCNPPYFQKDQGALSPSEFKNRCRFFLDSTFECLIESIVFSLAMDGEAFFLLRDLEDHGIDSLGDLRRILAGRLSCENLTMIRGTYLLRLSR